MLCSEKANHSNKLNASSVIKWFACSHWKDYINYLKATWTLFMKLKDCFPKFSWTYQRQGSLKGLLAPDYTKIFKFFFTIVLSDRYKLG